MKIATYVFSFMLLYNLLNAQDIIEYDYELDAYYSNISAYIDLDRESDLQDASKYSEIDIYKKLISHTFSPNIVLLEASIHPMSLGGLYFRDKNEQMYEKSKIQNVNMIKILTAGYEEPYSFSLFLGRMMVFKKKNAQHIGKNRAFMGYLFTVGDYSIKDNVAHYDKWINIEFKLKGTRELEDKDLDWSFRFGAKVHKNRDFANIVYVGARRCSIDYKKSIWSFVYNSAFSSMVGFNTSTMKLTEFEMILEKKWPISWSNKVSFGLGIGYLYNGGQKYSGALKEEGIDTHQLILRPNLKW